jgi:rSAM/selenodomain-associated transferase 1
MCAARSFSCGPKNERNMMRPALIFFVRAPLPGKVKTRLAEQIGADASLALYRAMGSDMLAKISKPDSWDTTVFFSPSENGHLVRDWLGSDYNYSPQRGDNLGERMHNALKDILDLGHRKALLTGSDIPELSTDIIGRAFSMLDSFDVVLGPAADGGYYLVGMKRPRRDMFLGIEWSGGTVYPDTCQKLSGMGLSYASLDTLCDIDRFDDIRSLVARHSNSRDSHCDGELVQTIRECKNILEAIK